MAKSNKPKDEKPAELREDAVAAQTDGDVQGQTDEQPAQTETEEMNHAAEETPAVSIEQPKPEAAAQLDEENSEKVRVSVCRAICFDGLFISPKKDGKKLIPVEAVLPHELIKRYGPNYFVESYGVHAVPDNTPYGRWQPK